MLVGVEPVLRDENLKANIFHEVPISVKLEMKMSPNQCKQLLLKCQ